MIFYKEDDKNKSEPQESIEDKFPSTLTLTYNCTATIGCGCEGHGCSASGSVQIFTSIYNYVTVKSNTGFSGIGTGKVTPFSTIKCSCSASSSYTSGVKRSPASLTITLSKK